MVVHMYGFNWQAYTDHVMPAFAQWLVENDAKILYALYKDTRCAHEEQFLPAVMHTTRTWSRAQSFVDALPSGNYARQEYRQLCSARQFHALSDHFVHRHPPQLTETSEALRIVWGALVEEYCRSPLTIPPRPATHRVLDTANANPHQHQELMSLLYNAGFANLAQQIDAQSHLFPDLSADPDFAEDEDVMQETGIAIGASITVLHMRGWLATISIQAMALFELLACGRRSMPFGFQAGEVFQNYIGYITPDEVFQLALCLRHTTPPESFQAEEDYRRFRSQQQTSPDDFRMIDEVLPAYGETFQHAVQMAAQLKQGLLCCID